MTRLVTLVVAAWRDYDSQSTTCLTVVAHHAGDQRDHGQRHDTKHGVREGEQRDVILRGADIVDESDDTHLTVADPATQWRGFIPQCFLWS